MAHNLCAVRSQSIAALRRIRLMCLFDRPIGIGPVRVSVITALGTIFGCAGVRHSVRSRMNVPLLVSAIKRSLSES